MIDPHWEDPRGCSYFSHYFWGKKICFVPLVYESFNWQHGVFLGASVSSETTAAAAGEVGKLRHDPFAMLPFAAINMGDYFAHWLRWGKAHDARKLPKIFHVNWFRKDEKGDFYGPDTVRISVY